MGDSEIVLDGMSFDARTLSGNRPLQRGTLKVSDCHTLYFEQAGNPNGKPIVFLHGEHQLIANISSSLTSAESVSAPPPESLLAR
jgi:hypothetical protein